jgi:sugar phosphate isomerase/epimerase
MNSKIGICQWSIPKLELKDDIETASLLGLDCVELELGSAKDGFPLSQKQNLQKYNELRKSLNIHYSAIAVNSLCSDGMSLASAHPAAKKAIALAIDTAVALKIPLIQLPSFVKGDIVTEDDFQNTVSCLCYACARASHVGILVGTENALSGDEQIRLIKEVDSDNLRVYFDTRNLFAMKNINSEKTLAQVMPWVCEVHVKDGIDNGDSMLLGQGNSGFNECMQILKDNNYTGWLILENNYTTMARNTDRSIESLVEQDIATIRAS